jgi:hypothetical protein
MMHTPPEQIFGAVHGELEPHMQEPEAQLSESVVLQAPHVPPPVPHSPVVGGSLHTFPAQHPEHDDGLHSQTPPEQTWPAPHGAAKPHSQVPDGEHWLDVEPQSTHEFPLVPHWLALGVSQVVPLQQPVGHDVLSQTQPPAVHS